MGLEPPTPRIKGAPKFFFFALDETLGVLRLKKGDAIAIWAIVELPLPLLSDTSTRPQEKQLVQQLP